MESLNSFIYNIRNSPKAGQGNSDDNKLNPRQIEFWIRYYRASILKEMMLKNLSIDAIFQQDLGVVPLTEVDMTDQNCSELLKWGCNIKKVKIPVPVMGSGNSPALWVGFINKQNPIIVSKANHVFFREKTHFGKNVNRSFLIGNTLYVMFKNEFKKTKYINVRLIAEQPKDAYNYSTEGCTPTCFNPMTDAYPLSLDVYQKIVDKIFPRELTIIQSSKTDEINDGREDT